MIDISFEVGVTGGKKARERGDVCIVVDALRASTTIIAALDAGFSSVTPVETAEECVGDVTAGERDGHKLPDMDHTNSPVEIYNIDGTGRELVLTTTNGTKCIHSCAAEDTHVLIGSIVNAEAVAEAAEQVAAEHGKNITVLLAGRHGELEQDDLLAASLIHHYFETATVNSDLQPVDLGEWQKKFIESAAAERLRQKNHANDVNFAAQLNETETVPVYANGTITRYGGEQPHAT